MNKYYIKYLINKFRIRFNKYMYNEYWTTIKQETIELKSRIKNECSEMNTNRHANTKLLNSKCSKCDSRNVIDKYERIKGKGSFDMSGSSVFGIGSMSGRSNISLDTKIVNECSDCGNQWKKANYNYNYPSTGFDSYINEVYWFRYRHNNLTSVTYDVTDASESYDSLEAKEEDLKLYVRSTTNAIKKYSNGISIDTLLELYKFKPIGYRFSVRNCIAFYKGKYKEECLRLFDVYDLQDKLIRDKKNTKGIK